MSKRITIMIDDDIDRVLRIKQAHQIKKVNGSYSFSQTINDTLRKNLR
jgi:hypothetical protein